MEQEISTTLGDLLNDETPFFAYRRPEEDSLHLGRITTARSFKYDMLEQMPEQAGFVMVPFHTGEARAWWLGTEEMEAFKLPQKERRPDQSPVQNQEEDPESFASYAEQFRQMMSALTAGKVQKVILSRTITLNRDLKHDLPGIFLRLTQRYPAAFCYLVASPQTGIWLGASPELLFAQHDQQCTTVSLAGTRSSEGSPSDWTAKEREEQGLVSSYIDQLLGDFGVSTYQKNGPEIIKAGNLTHLKTSYSFKQSEIHKLAQFVEALHPTPALCGEPKMQAMALIRKVEQHQRLYYGGFMGPLGNADCHLFVNIRCMNTAPDRSTLYVGGGLTRQSELHSEWNETVMKSRTLLSVLSPRQA